MFSSVLLRKTLQRSAFASTSFGYSLCCYSQKTSFHSCALYHLGQVSYENALRLQHHLVQAQLQAERDHQTISDVILLLEHPSVYTIGRGGSYQNILFDVNHPQCPHQVIRTTRGGEVTYHGPGQLVVYPILNLRRYRQDLHWYLRKLEEVVIRLLRMNGIEGQRMSGLTGVWTKEETKVAAIGTHATQWITMHGFALNVTTDLRAFEQIIPCGISDKKVTSLAKYTPQITMQMVRQQAGKAFEEVFPMKIQEKSPAQWIEEYHLTEVSV